jgi:hypothetical protein
LLSLYKDNRIDGWNWFENKLTYRNAAMSHAMLLCGQSIPNPAMTEVGLESLGWLSELQHADTEGKHFVPIGSNGFYQQGGERARFDQQPVEAQAMVSACLEAHRITGKKAGTWKPCAPSSGFWGETTCISRYTTRQQVAVAMVCILTGRTRIKAQSLLSPFSSHFWN